METSELQTHSVRLTVSLVTLPIDQLKPIQWNEGAFESLAVDDDTKELVEALVTNKIEADKGTDVVAGKGTGLIMLLHG